MGFTSLSVTLARSENYLQPNYTIGIFYRTVVLFISPAGARITTAPATAGFLLQFIQPYDKLTRYVQLEP
jgi:chloramphenicol O-acetyltransferase